jgi:hypothetical protein
MALESKRNHVDRVTMGRTPPLSFDKTVRAPDEKTARAGSGMSPDNRSDRMAAMRSAQDWSSASTFRHEICQPVGPAAVEPVFEMALRASAAVMLMLSDTLAPGRAVAVVAVAAGGGGGGGSGAAAAAAAVDVPVLGGRGNVLSAMKDERGSRGGGNREDDANSGAATCSA